jgi:hypothetical protein
LSLVAALGTLAALDAQTWPPIARIPALLAATRRRPWHRNHPGFLSPGAKSLDSKRAGFHSSLPQLSSALCSSAQLSVTWIPRLLVAACLRPRYKNLCGYSSLANIGLDPLNAGCRSLVPQVPKPPWVSMPSRQQP